MRVAYRRFVIRALSLPMRRPRSAPAWSARPYDVLYLRPDRVGDMIVSTGLLRAIATSHSTIRMHVLVTPSNAGVLEHNPHVASVVLLHHPKRPGTWLSFARAARRARYDAVIDCKVVSPSLTLLLLMLASGARERIGVGGRANDAAYSVPVPAADWHAHNIEQLGALAAAFGVDVATFDWQPEIFLQAAERDAAERLWRPPGEGVAADRGELRLLVNVSAGKARCRWPAERYIDVLREMGGAAAGAARPGRRDVARFGRAPPDRRRDRLRDRQSRAPGHLGAGGERRPPADARYWSGACGVGIPDAGGCHVPSRTSNPLGTVPHGVACGQHCGQDARLAPGGPGRRGAREAARDGRGRRTSRPKARETGQTDFPGRARDPS